MTASSGSWALELWEALREQLNDENNAATEELIPCGKQYIQVLRADRTSSEISSQLGDLTRLAHEMMSRAYRNSQPTLCWRRLYTDACIIHALVDYTAAQGLQDMRIPLESISRLDKAIIVAGPAGEGRLNLILGIISKMQDSLFAPERDPLFSSFPHHDLRAPIPDTFSGDISQPNTPPSLASFLTKYSRAPFILRGFILDWPAMKEHPWSSIQYLRSVAGPGRLVPIEVGQDYRSEDWNQKLMPWDEFLDSLASSTNGNPTPILYLAQHDLLKQFPALRDDIIIPDYVYAAPLPPDNYPAYCPPKTDDQLVVNVWLGPGGTISPAHTDPFFNLYAQVVGRKTVWLAPPEATSHMYAYSPTSDGVNDQPHNPAANTTSPTLSNTSQVDVFARLNDIDEDSPLFKEHVVPRAVCATLEPGDLLFFPPGWWHAMRSEETSFSVSMWF